MEAFRHASTKPTLLLLLALYFIVTLAFSGFEATFAIFSEAKFGYTASTIGFVFAFIGVILALVQGVLVGKVVKVVSERRLIPLAIFAIALGIGLIPFVWNVPTLLGALVRAGGRHGLQQPVAVVDGVAACRPGRSRRNPWPGLVARQPGPRRRSRGRRVFVRRLWHDDAVHDRGGVDDGGLRGVVRRSAIGTGAANEGGASASGPTG